MTMRVCTICARGGSKGVPGKNTRMLMGKPLIAHTIEQARASGLFADVGVSSDSEAILAVAREYGVDVLVKRPADMATDEAGKLPAIAHAIRSVQERTGRRYDVAVDLDATSPLRLPEDIVSAVMLLENTGCTSVITAAPAHRSPYFTIVERNAEGFAQLSKPLARPVLRRQDAPECFDMNGSVYVWQAAKFLAEQKPFYADTRLYVMPRERSIDIDEELDFVMVDMLMKQRGG